MSQLNALLISIGMEVPLAMGLCLGLRWVERADWHRLLAVATCTTLITHPFAWWGYRTLRNGLDLSRWPAFAIVEIAVSLVEAAMYWRLARIPPLKAVILAFAVNAFSAFWGRDLAKLLGLI
jgi:hypothetical protein